MFNVVRVPCQVRVVEQAEALMIDRALFRRWLQPPSEHSIDMQLSVLLRIHCHAILDGKVGNATDSDEQSCGEMPSEEEQWALRSWSYVRRSVLEAEASRGVKPDGTEGENEIGETPMRDAPRARSVQDEALARWLTQVVEWHSNDDLLFVLRDELTAVQELEALTHPVEESGTWEPDDLAASKTQEELMGDFLSQLGERFGAATGAMPAAASEGVSTSRSSSSVLDRGTAEFDMDGMSAAERASLESYGAARLAGAPIVHPPQALTTRALVREDTPFYIALAFLKIFQTGAADYWAFVQQRQERGLAVSLWEWFQHVLRHRSGRALRHPRFYYFAINTILRNKAVRGKSYFVRRSYGSQAYEEFTPQSLLAMGKSQMARVLCAYEGKLPGSAAEKLSQRSDLDAMLTQLEEESAWKAREILPSARSRLGAALSAVRSDQRLQSDDVLRVAELEQLAEAELSRSASFEQSAVPVEAVEPDDAAGVGFPHSADDDPLKYLRECTSHHWRLRRCVEQRGEVPVHFLTFTTAIFYWADLERLLRDYEERIAMFRGGRRDPLEPGEDRVPEDGRFEIPTVVYLVLLRSDLITNMICLRVCFEINAAVLPAGGSHSC